MIEQWTYLYIKQMNKAPTYLGDMFRMGLDMSPTPPGKWSQQTEPCVWVCSRQISFRGNLLKSPNIVLTWPILNTVQYSVGRRSHILTISLCSTDWNWWLDSFNLREQNLHSSPSLIPSPFPAYPQQGRGDKQTGKWTNKGTKGNIITPDQ